MSKADYRKTFCEPCMSQTQCGYYRDNDGEYCPMLKFYDMGYHQAENYLIDKTLDFLKDKLYENGYVGIIDLCDDYIKAMKDE